MNMNQSVNKILLTLTGLSTLKKKFFYYYLSIVKLVMKKKSLCIMIHNLDYFKMRITVILKKNILPHPHY